MKLTTVFLLIGCLHLSAASYSQTITLEVNNLSLKDVFSEIQKQTGYNVVYNVRFLNRAKPVSVFAKQMPLEIFLKRILSDQALIYDIREKTILIGKAEYNPLVPHISNTNVKRQERVYAGNVTDELGNPLEGVTVSAKDIQIAVVTDKKGNYQISVPEATKVLVFTIVGFETVEYTLGNQLIIDISLKASVTDLEEIVVVGFGTQKKTNLTGAVGTVSTEDLQNRPVQNVQQALQGLIPGLNIWQTSGMLNSTPEVNIRGTGNLGTGSTASPLIIIDGVESNISYINPQDIESISVLKDAAASSIYGSRAPFGVILITTKKGDSGNIKLNYNNSSRWGAPIILPQVMDSYTQATFINDLCLNDNVTPHFTEERLKRIKDYQLGLITTVNVPDPANPSRWSSGYAGGNADNDIYDIYYKDWAFTQEHQVSASGGGNRFTFYVGMRYLDKNGLLEIADDIYKLYTPVGTVEAQMTDWLKLRYTTRFVRRDYDRPTDLSPNLFVDLGRQGWSSLPYTDDNGIINNTGQAMNLIYGGRTKEQTDVFNNHGSVILEPVRNWVTTVEFNYNTTSYHSNAASLMTYMYDVEGDPYLRRDRSYVSNSYSKDNFMTLNAYSSYNMDLFNDHHISVMGGAQLEQMKRIGFGLSRDGVIVRDLPVVDLTTGLNNNGQVVTPSVNGSLNEWSTTGFFGRLNYNYKERYLLEANLRYDGTSRFRKDQRWNLFPSFSIGWNIARENFWEGLINTVDVLKLRGSYGNLGNQNTDNWYPTYQVINVSSSSGPWLQNGLRPNTAYSPELISTSLTWEKINTWNMGLDIGAFSNRLTGSFDYYVRKTLDMVGPAMELPTTLGKSVPPSNNTDLETSGFELELAWQGRSAGGLSYRTRFLLSDSRTKITRYPNLTKSLSTYYEGQYLGNIWGYETIGIAKSNDEMQAHLASLPEGGQTALGNNWAAGDIMYRDLNGDGKINSGSNTFDDPGDRKIIGNSSPRYTFGLDLNAAWKGFDIRMFFQGVGKRDAFTDSPMFFGINRMGFWNQIGLKEHVDYFRAEPSNDLPANLDAYYARPLYYNSAKNQQTQTRYLQNAAYIRLKNLSVGYAIPSTITRRLFANNLRLFFSAENIWTYTELAKMFDPESIRGINYQGDGYPIEKSFSFGLNVTF